MRWFNDLTLKAWFFLQKIFHRQPRIKVACPHCRFSNKLGFSSKQLSLGVTQVSFSCCRCHELMVVLIVDRSVLIATAKADKKFRHEDIGTRIIHLHQSLLRDLFKSGAAPSAEEKLRAFMEAMEDIHNTPGPITKEEADNFSHDLDIMRCPTDEELF